MPIKTALVDRAIREWKSFGEDLGRNDKFIDPAGKTTTAKQTGGHANPRKETVEPFASRVADFWLAIPSDAYNKLVAENAKDRGKLDGTIDLAWSAAFISYCMRMAGAGPLFSLRVEPFGVYRPVDQEPAREQDEREHRGIQIG